MPTIPLIMVKAADHPADDCCALLIHLSVISSYCSSSMLLCFLDVEVPDQRQALQFLTVLLFPGLVFQ